MLRASTMAMAALESERMARVAVVSSSRASATIHHGEAAHHREVAPSGFRGFLHSSAIHRPNRLKVLSIYSICL